MPSPHALAPGDSIGHPTWRVRPTFREERRPITRWVYAAVGAVIGLALLSGALPAPTPTAPTGPGAARHPYSTPAAADPAPDPVTAEAAAWPPVADQPVPGLVGHAGTWCAGTGQDGNRVQVVYLHDPAGRGTVARLRPRFLEQLRIIDDIMALSAARTGSGRRVRWVTSTGAPGCVPAVLSVSAPPAVRDDYDRIREHLAARGLDRTDRKYLVFTDSAGWCGLGDSTGDDQPGPGNSNNHGPSYALVSRWCWFDGDKESTAAHELVHTLGSVNGSAAHATALAHCDDEADLMCYDDATGTRMRKVCPPWTENLLDCGNDDYFHTSPAPGSYLDTHWNTANSAFLVTVPPLHVAPQLQVTARATGRQRVTVSARTDQPAARVEFPDRVAGCRLITRGARSASYQCMLEPGTARTLTVQAQGTHRRVAHASVTVKVTGDPIVVVADGPLVAGRWWRLEARATLPTTRFDWERPIGCRLRSDGSAVAWVLCGPRQVGRLVDVTAFAEVRNAADMPPSKTLLTRVAKADIRP